MLLTSRVLIVLGWVSATALVFCLYMIARFFQQKSEQRSYYQVFLVPVALLVVGALYSVLPGKDFAASALSNGLFFIAGVGTITLGNYLFNLMTGGKK